LRILSDLIINFRAIYNAKSATTSPKEVFINGITSFQFESKDNLENCFLNNYLPLTYIMGKCRMILPTAFLKSSV